MKVVVVVASPCAVPGKETTNGDLVVSTQLLELLLPLQEPGQGVGTQKQVMGTAQPPAGRPTGL